MGSTTQHKAKVIPIANLNNAVVPLPKTSWKTKVKKRVKTLIFVGTAVGVCTTFIEFVRANPFDKDEIKNQQKQQIETPPQPTKDPRKSKEEELLKLGTCF